MIGAPAPNDDDGVDDGPNRSPRLLTFAQASRLSLIPLNALYDWSAKGRLDAVKVSASRRTLLDRDAFIRLIISQSRR